MRSRAGKASALLVIVALALTAQQKKREWKDRGEYDLYDAIAKTSDPKAWLDGLNQWSQQYPQTEYAEVRRQMYLETYRSLDRPRETFNAAQDVLKDNPNSLVALSAVVGYIYRLNPPGSSPGAGELDVAEKACGNILANLDSIYAKPNRPPQMTDADAAKAKSELKIFAQKTLGWIAYSRKDWDRAETEFVKALELDPRQGQVSYWLGSAILGERKPEKQAPALYQFARAAAYDGSGSLPASDRQQIQSYLHKVYEQYHGSAEGLDKLLASARTGALPPADFTVKSSAIIDKEKLDAEEAETRANPGLALWKNIKAELMGENGPAYFESSMRDAALPGGAGGVMKFTGRLVSETPPGKPKQLTLAIEKPGVADAILKIDSALTGKMEPGAEIEFEGIAKGYTKEPYLVTFEVEKSKIAGWTGRNEAAGKKRAAAKKQP